MTPEQVMEAIAASKKYRRVSRETILRIAAATLERGGDRASGGAAVKAVKRKLHQICAAFISPNDVEGVAGLVAAMRDGGAPVQAVCDAVLRLHASTAERLPYYPEFYSRVFAVTGVPRSVLDIGCGLHPFSLPYMGIPAPFRYVATDIDALVVGCVNGFLASVGYEPCARVQDAISTPPADEVDLALALKLLPVLEQQVKGGSLGVLKRVRARRLIVSFPLASLGGARKGMPVHYRKRYEKALADEFRMIGEFDVPNELVYILERRPGPEKERQP